MRGAVCLHCLITRERPLYGHRYGGWGRLAASLRVLCIYGC